MLKIFSFFYLLGEMICQTIWFKKKALQGDHWGLLQALHLTFAYGE